MRWRTRTRRAAIFVLPALSDAMPNVVLEAMASGLAIVTTRTGASELIDGNGLVVETSEVAALRTAIARYLDDPALLARHQRRSRQLAEAMSWSTVADYFSTLYREVVAAPRGAVLVPPRDFTLRSQLTPVTTATVRPDSARSGAYRPRSAGSPRRSGSAP